MTLKYSQYLWDVYYFSKVSTKSVLPLKYLQKSDRSVPLLQLTNYKWIPLSPKSGKASAKLVGFLHQILINYELKSATAELTFGKVSILKRRSLPPFFETEIDFYYLKTPISIGRAS